MVGVAAAVIVVIWYFLHYHSEIVPAVDYSAVRGNHKLQATLSMMQPGRKERRIMDDAQRELDEERRR